MGQLIDEPQQSWTETSGSAMFTYAIIEGLKMDGLIKTIHFYCKGKLGNRLFLI